MSAPPDSPEAPDPAAPAAPARRDDGLRDARAREAALALPLFGLALLAPPVANFFAVDRAVLGAPLIAVYLFAVWACLVLGALRLARRLREPGRR